MTIKEKILALLADCGTMTEAEIRDELRVSHGTFYTKKEELVAEGKVQQFRLGKATVYQTTLAERAKVKEGATDVKTKGESQPGQVAPSAAGAGSTGGASASKADSMAAGCAVPASAAPGDVANGSTSTKELLERNAGKTEETIKSLKAVGISKERINKGMETGRITGVYPTIDEWIDEITGENDGATVETNLDGTQLVVTLADGGQQVYAVHEVAGGVDIEEW